MTSHGVFPSTAVQPLLHYIPRLLKTIYVLVFHEKNQGLFRGLLFHNQQGEGLACNQECVN